MSSRRDSTVIRLQLCHACDAPDRRASDGSLLHLQPIGAQAARWPIQRFSAQTTATIPHFALQETIGTYEVHRRACSRTPSRSFHTAHFSYIYLVKQLAWPRHAVCSLPRQSTISDTGKRTRELTNTQTHNYYCLRYIWPVDLRRSKCLIH
jgi:hypothetical protein